ncbi:sunset domain-containing protein [Tessaracoccus caeni]|uniref:sunset domain-containing protein n=1 Tax=Tessaracoccus caeni TaxID=3031239 RepID=UPI0029E7E134|nr:hypothetical protein [Tessaracoccus caeni]
MKTSQELRKAAADSASAAAEYGQHALKEGLELAKDGLDHAQELLQQATEQAAPLLKEAKVRSADFASRQLDAAEPHIKSALDKVTPVVEAAREKVSDEILPKLQDALHAAAEHPVVAAPLAAAGIEVAKPKKKSKLKAFGKVLAVGALVAGALAAVRHFLAPKDDGWTAHEPSRAYVNNNDTFATAAKVATESASEEPEQEPQPAHAASPDEEEAISEMLAEGAPEQGQTYGEGAYLGTEPPEGFTIKGNERSKKYHLPGSGGYERTNAEVWFNSEEAAEAAGFTKAQR